jgi:tetratricopeptide (TPR) repeat protein
MDRQNEAPRFCLAVLYDNHDMYEEAIDQYSEIIRFNPKHIKSLYNMGRISFQLGNYEASLNQFNDVLELDPNNADAWNNVGLVHEAGKNYSEAIASYRKSLSLNPFHEETNFNIANLQYLLYRDSCGDIKVSDIIRRLNFILSLNPHNQKVNRLLSKIEKNI